jgi:phage terminase small subunit
MSDKPLSPRHLHFVHEYLKDGNATQAYIRAGYAPRHAQSCASRLLAQPDIEAALATARQRLAQSLEATVERVAQEYAKIAFANVQDFIEVEADGRLRVDLSKASQAQCAGLLEVSVTDHGKQSQTVRLKLGKLKALDALTRQMGVLVKKPAPGLTAEDRARLEEQNAALRRLEAHQRSEQQRLQRELKEARKALAEAKAEIDHAGYAVLDEEEPSLWTDEDEASPPTPEREPPPIVIWPTDMPARKSCDAWQTMATGDGTAPSAEGLQQTGEQVLDDGVDHALALVGGGAAGIAGGAGGRELVTTANHSIRRQADWSGEACGQGAAGHAALGVGGGVGQLVHTDVAAVDRQHDGGLALVGVAALAHLDPPVGIAAEEAQMGRHDAHAGGAVDLSQQGVDRCLGRDAGVEQQQATCALGDEALDQLAQQRAEGRGREMLAAGVAGEGGVVAEGHQRGDQGGQTGLAGAAGEALGIGAGGRGVGAQGQVGAVLLGGGADRQDQHVAGVEPGLGLDPGEVFEPQRQVHGATLAWSPADAGEARRGLSGSDHLR